MDPCRMHILGDCNPSYMDKRTFLRRMGLAAFATPLTMDALAGLMREVADVPPAALAGDEAFWKAIRN